MFGKKKPFNWNSRRRPSIILGLVKQIETIPEQIDIKQDLQPDGLPTTEVKLPAPVVTKISIVAWCGDIKSCPDVKH